VKLPVFRDPVTGEPSFSVTVAAITFTVVLVRWCLGGLVLGGHTFTEVDDASITTWLTPTLLLYFGRMATKATENVALVRATGERAPP
jgi:hypothetical protein